MAIYYFLNAQNKTIEKVELIQNPTNPNLPVVRIPFGASAIQSDELALISSLSVQHPKGDGEADEAYAQRLEVEFAKAKGYTFIDTTADPIDDDEAVV